MSRQFDVVARRDGLGVLSCYVNAGVHGESLKSVGLRR